MQAGKVRDRWGWTAPTAWTDRMLTALEAGVKGNVWFSLIDKVHSEKHLFHAAQRVLGNKGAPGVDHVTVEQFDENLLENVRKLSQGLREGTYQPQSIRRTHIPKPGTGETRPLGIPTVRDRVVQNALRQVLEPIFERDFAEQSYGFRPGRGAHEALQRVEELVKSGHGYVVDVDLKSYFDTIPHDKLLERVGEKVSDGRVLKLIEAFLKADVLDGLEEWTPIQGAPQGAVLSPLLSNIYLDPLDHLMARAGFEMVRYADDFVILCRTWEAAEQALAMVQDWTAEAGLTVHPTKTRIVTVEEGFDFLGYFIRPTYRTARKKSREKLKAVIRQKTPRSSGDSLQAVIRNLNRTLRGWFAYFRDSTRTTFRELDSWIRMRLRRILRQREGFRNYGRDADHRRWPNNHFAPYGLFSLEQAQAAYRQSCCR
jgi:RNA-directed DNA polymerase